MADESYGIRLARSEDDPSILELLRLSLGDGGAIPRTREYWHWKHRQNPFGESPILVAESDNQLVGIRVFLRWTWMFKGERVAAVRAVDTATHPDWQGRGIFTKLTLRLAQEIKDQGTSLIFNTPNSKSRPGYIKMGWHNAGRVSLWGYAKRPWASLTPRKGSVGSLESGGSPVEGLVDSYQWKAKPVDGRLATLKTEDYLRWRYCANPAFEYRAAWVEDGESAVGLIWRVRQRGRLVELRICELLVGPDRSSKRAARRILLQLMRETQADYLVAMAAPGTPEMNVLARSGFLPIPKLGPVFTLRLLDEDRDLGNPQKLSGWRLSIGDLELF